MWYKNTTEHLVGAVSSNIKNVRSWGTGQAQDRVPVERHVLGATKRIRMQKQDEARAEGLSFSQFQWEQKPTTHFSVLLPSTEAWRGQEHKHLDPGG